MVVVKIELWPSGMKDHAEQIGEIHIENDGTGDTKFGNYRVFVKHGGIYSGKKGNWKTGTVKKFNRMKSPYHLVFNALRNALFPYSKSA